MMRAPVATALAFAFAALPAAAQDWSADSGAMDEPAGIRVPAGFAASVFGDDLGVIRHMAVTDGGVVYASLRQRKNGGGILALKDTDGDGVADIKEYFGDVVGTGLAIHDGHLYFGTSTEIVRWPLPGEGMVPQGAPQTIVSGFPRQAQHATKPMTFDGSGHMFVTVGAPSNACQRRMRTPGSPGLDPCPQLEAQAGIWRYDADETGQTHSPNKRYAAGIRNALAIDWHAAADALFFATHGRDQLNYIAPEHFTAQENAERVAEEFHKAEEGAHYGWPNTYYDPLADKRVLAPEYGGDGETAPEAGKYRDPLIDFPAHWAPNDLVFYTRATTFPAYFHNGGFLAWHGSWNRAPLPQGGYNVSFIPMNAAGEITGDWIVFADGFKGTEVLESPGDAAHRPTGVAIGPDGALYIADDHEGRMWRVTYEGR